MDWQLPQNINDRLAPESHWIENKRRALLDLYFSWGYRFIMPPIAEYQEALAQGGPDLDRHMLKVVDHVSGRMMALRPDLTPQAARIDAHVLNEQGITRLCYCDRVLHAYPVSPFAEREPLHVGAEIYGSSNWGADVEIIALLDASLRLCGIHDHHIELHHMGLLRELAVLCQVSPSDTWQNNAQELYFLQCLHTKNATALEQLLEKIEPALRQSIIDLLQLYGAPNILDQARHLLPKNNGIRQYLDQIDRIVHDVNHRYPHIQLSLDLSDGRGYHYHTGIMFSVYSPDWSQALANGGRYDGFGERFGRKRPATGFTLELFEVFNMLKRKKTDFTTNPDHSFRYQRRFFAPALAQACDQGRKMIHDLRQQGHAVIVEHAPLGTKNDNDEIEKQAKQNGCDAWLIKTAKGWTVS